MDRIPVFYKNYLVEKYEFILQRLAEISTTTYCIALLAISIPPIIALVIYEREQARLLAEQPKGCRKLGMNIESNLLNEFEQKFSEGRPPSTEETSAEWWRLKSMWIYPIKGCRGVELNRGTIVSTGMEYDRQFTFARLRSPFPVGPDASEKEKSAHVWEFVSQKHFPRLENVRTEMWVPDQSVDTFSPEAEDVESGGVIVISFPYLKPGWRGTIAKWGAAVKGTIPEKQFRIPFDPSPAQTEKAGYTLEKMKIWGDTITALNMEIEIPEELRCYLGISNKLGIFRIHNPKASQVTPNASDNLSLDTKRILGFQDAYPIHLVNLASIRDIEANMVKTKTTPRLSAAQFRANLIVTGPEPYHEDCWRRVQIGFYEYDVTKRTSNFTIPEKKADEKNNTESKWNRVIDSYRSEEGRPGLDVSCLGVTMCALSKEAALRVGDEIVVKEVDAAFSEE
ncbi:hypothetical protein K3495_g9835 [Podosphaera aphanis]|nr:hypothetical protein K3495_g9835 [Podosphaera aphanis]